MRLIDADHLRRWILSRAFKTQLTVADVIDQIDREDTIELDQKNERDLVRCGDCRFINNCEIQHSAQAGDMFFCGAAERKEE